MERRDDGSENLTWSQRTEADDIPTTFNDDRAGGIGHWVPKPTDALKKSQ